MAGIQVFCFVASYAVAFLLEVTRLWFKSGARGALLVGFAAAGFVAHTLFLVNLALRDPATGAPLASWFEWYLAAAWALAVAYLYLTWSHPRTPVGLFLLPVILALIGVGYRFQGAPGFSRDAALTFWGWAHGITLLAGSVVVIGGFIAGATYLLHSELLKRKAMPTAGLRLPSLEWLEAVNNRALPLSAVLLGMGLLTGVVLNLIKQQRQLDLVPWNDPVIWSTAILFGWLVAACAFSFIYRPARQGRKVAYLTIASLAFLLLVLVMTLYYTDHGGVESRNTSASVRLPSLARSASEGELTSGTNKTLHEQIINSPLRANCEIAVMRFDAGAWGWGKAKPARKSNVWGIVTACCDEHRSPSDFDAYSRVSRVPAPGAHANSGDCATSTHLHRDNAKFDQGGLA